MSKEIELLNGQLGDAKQIKELIVQSGWKLMEKWLKDFWTEGFEEVRNANGDTYKLLEGNSKMKVVEMLTHRIGITLGFGEQALERYNRITQ